MDDTTFTPTDLQQVFINRIKRQIVREQQLLAKALKRLREQEALEAYLEQQSEIEQGLRILEVSGSASI